MTKNTDTTHGSGRHHDPLTPITCSTCRHLFVAQGRLYCRENRKEIEYNPNRLILCKNYGNKGN